MGSPRLESAGQRSWTLCSSICAKPKSACHCPRARTDVRHVRSPQHPGYDLSEDVGAAPSRRSGPWAKASFSGCHQSVYWCFGSLELAFQVRGFLDAAAQLAIPVCMAIGLRRRDLAARGLSNRGARGLYFRQRRDRNGVSRLRPVWPQQRRRGASCDHQRCTRRSSPVVDAKSQLQRFCGTSLGTRSPGPCFVAGPHGSGERQLSVLHPVRSSLLWSHWHQS